MVDRGRARIGPAARLFCEPSGRKWSEDTGPEYIGRSRGGQSVEIRIIRCELPVGLTVETVCHNVSCLHALSQHATASKLPLSHPPPGS